MLFKNREEAGQKLAEALKEYQGKPQTIVLALPRGGVVVGAEVARELRLPLDIMVTRKIGAPGNSEYAIGALTASGQPIWNESEKNLVSPERLKQLVDQERAEARRRLETYRAGRPPLNLGGQTVILVDDGIATGYTIRAAINFVKAERPRQIIVAVPHGAADTLELLAKEVDKLVVLFKPEWYGAVGAFYEEFGEVRDEEVIKLMSATPGDFVV